MSATARFVVAAAHGFHVLRLETRRSGCVAVTTGGGPGEAAWLAERIAHFVPHNRALGIRFVSLTEQHLTLALPYDEKLVGNPTTGVIHGGAITALLDAACGTAVLFKLGRGIPVATLDLRIDYLRPATPHRDVYGRAECFRVTQDVAFVRCEAFHAENATESGSDRPRELVAVANGTFILFRGGARNSRGAKP